MKSSQAGAVSGCIVWMLSIGIIATCILPISVMVGSITSFSQFAITATGNFICPDGTTAERYEYATTMTDEFGNSNPATGYELHCVDESGEVVKTDVVGYAFLWIGVFALVGFIVSGILAFVFAIPLGVLIGRLFKRTQKRKVADNTEPT
jgi:ABC-type glycerol-3-phosphate transport system permease component